MLRKSRDGPQFIVGIAVRAGLKDDESENSSFPLIFCHGRAKGTK